MANTDNNPLMGFTEVVGGVEVCSIIVILIIALFGSSRADADEPLFYFPKMKTHQIKSDAIDQTYEIHVLQPVSKKNGSERFPVLYMTDANAGIPFEQVTRSMQAAGEIPRFIVVGIGYPVDTVYGSLNLRQRDLTPTEAERDGYGFALEGIEKLKSGKTSGGADAFLRFIQEQVKPFIDENYNTTPDENAYFGHSLGGLFGLYVLFNEPKTFNRYILGSPAIWWDDETILSDAEKFLETNKSVKARVYMAAGGKEETNAPGAHYVSNLYRLDAMLRSKSIRGFELETEIYPNHEHVGVLGMLNMKGIPAVYDKPECPPILPAACN